MEDSMKRLQVMKHKNNAGVFGRRFKAGGPEHKDPSRKPPGSSEEQQRQCD